MCRWWTRTPLSSHIDVTPLAACWVRSTTVPPWGSAARSVVGHATSAGLSGLTSTATRPSAVKSASLGTPSLAGSSAMNTVRLGSNVVANTSETSRAVMPGSSRWSSARRWAAGSDGVPAGAVAIALAPHLARRARRLAPHRLFRIGGERRARALQLALVEAVETGTLQLGPEVLQHGTPRPGPGRGPEGDHSEGTRPLR